MENASKALIYAASIIVGVMIMSFMVFIFKRFGDTASTTEKRMSQKEIVAFNSKFVNYETGGNHNLDDTFTLTFVANENGNNFTRSNLCSYKNIFCQPIHITPSDVNKALISASQILNKPSDVVTAINDAINVNAKNNNDYKYNNLEVQNSVEIIVDLESLGATNEFDFSRMKRSYNHFRYLMIEPNANVKAKNIYGFYNITMDKETNTENKEANVENLKDKFTDNDINVYDMLKELTRDGTKVIKYNNKAYTVYKYYFMGQVFTNEYTGLVETVKFTLVEDKNF